MLGAQKKPALQRAFCGSQFENLPTSSGVGSQAFRYDFGGTLHHHMLSIITCPKPEHDTCVAPSISRAKS